MNGNLIVANNLKNGMTVGELRKALEWFGDDDPVMFAYNANDYWNTKVAEPVKDIEDICVVYDDYHDKWKVIPLDLDAVDNPDAQLAVVINF